MREKIFKQAMFETVDCFGIDVCLLNVSELIKEIEYYVEQRRQLTISYLNFHTTSLIQSAHSASAVFQSFDIVVPDGIALTWALGSWGGSKARDSLLRHVEVEPCLPVLYSIAVEQRWGVYLLGGEPEVAARFALDLMQTFPGIGIVGTHHGYLKSDEELLDVINDINQSGALILLVGMGQPKQEEWIVANQHRLDVLILVAVGGYFDKVSKINAYPEWVYRYRLFWLYRFINEPKRLWKRYTIGIVVFGLRVLRVKLASIFSHTNRR